MTIPLIPLAIYLGLGKVYNHSPTCMSKKHIVMQLLSMLIRDKLYGFQFYNDVSTYNQIHTICLLQLHIIPIHWEFFLLFYLVAILF